MSYRRLLFVGLLAAALAAWVSAPAATMLVTCVPLDAVAASPRAPLEELAAEECVPDGMSVPAFGRTPEITRC